MTAMARVIGPVLVGLAYDALQTRGAIASQVAVVTIGIAMLARLLTSGERASEPHRP